MISIQTVLDFLLVFSICLAIMFSAEQMAHIHIYTKLARR